MFLAMASHGTDQLIIQRVLATGDARKAQKAMVLSGVLVAFQFALFLFVGTLLYYFYGNTDISANEVFARFIIDYIPSGFTGLIIAGIFAAAMSTLSGSISSLSSATVMDIILPLGKRTYTEDDKLSLSRRYSIVWAVLIIAAACLFIQTPQTVIELALGIASFTYGGILGLFLLGRLVPSVTPRTAIAGFIAGIAGMTFVVLFTSIAWTWYTLIGTVITIVVALFAKPIVRKEDTA
jgi:solute:Na+ symporter, SSS family